MENENEKDKLTRLYQCNPGQAATELLACVLSSSAKGKWPAFIQALRDAEYPHLASMVENVKYELGHDYYRHERKMIALFASSLEQQIDARDMADHLGKILSNEDHQEVLAVSQTRGNTYANIVLMDCLQCRHHPRDWYGAFLDALINTGREDLVEQLEPEYLKNPSGFMQNDLGPIYVDEASSNRLSADREGDGEAYASVRENVLSNVVEQNDLSMDVEAPPPPPPRLDSLQTSGTFTEIYHRDTDPHIFQPNITATRHGVQSREAETDDQDSDTEFHSVPESPNLADFSINFNSKLNIKPEATKLPLVSSNQADQANQASKDDADTVESDAEYEPGGDDTDTDNSLSSGYEDDTEDSISELRLRRDQLELAENALLGRNTIVCSGTGTGKTWVALHVVEKHLQQPSNGPRKVVFMARTGVLIKQQSDRFKKYLHQFQTKLFSGEEDDTKMINAFLPEYDILCLTPQILVNNLNSGSVRSLTEFSLMILDECHHTRGDEPYSNLMRRYLVEKRQGNIPLPQIIGLTASIGVSKAKTEEDAVQYLLSVCARLDVRMLSTVERNREEHLKHTQEPVEQVVPMIKPKDNPCEDILLAVMDDTEDKLQNVGILQPELTELFFDKCPRDKASQEYNKWTVEVQKTAQMNHAVEDDSWRDIIMCAKYLNNYNAALEVNSLLRGRDVGKFLADRCKEEAQNKERLTERERELLQELNGVMKRIMKETKDVANPNVTKLTNILRQMLQEKGEDSRAMVFVKARATCKALADFLNKELNPIMVRPLYGKDNRGFEDGMTQAAQDETVERFKSGVYKVLVSTSVGTEGLDVPACNIVLSYNYSGNEITKTQMKGRIRKEGGTNVMMGNEKLMEQEMLNTYKVAMMHKAMKRVKQMNEKDIERRIAFLQEQELREYRTKQEVDRYKKSRRSQDDDYEIRCRRCNTLACRTSDVRMVKRQFIVIDKALAEKIKIKPHKRPKKFDGFHKKFKMYCNKCPMDWGIVSENRGLPCRTLKLDSFQLKSMRTGDMRSYSKWDDVPYDVPEIEVEDLPKLFGEEGEGEG